jgi:hypothetical protein
MTKIQPIESTNSNDKSSFSIKNLSFDEKLSYSLLILLLLIIILIRTKFLNIPFERDEGAYSYYGKLLLDGKIPYKDFYEQKFPGVFYFYAFIVKLFGSTVRDLHIGFLFLNLFSVVLIFFASKNIFNSISAIIAAATFAFVSLTPMISGFTIQSEHGVAFFTSLGIYFYSLGLIKQKWYFYLAMGLAMGCAFMTKTTGVFMALWGGAIIIIDVLFSKKRELKTFLIQIVWYAVGGFSVIALMFLLIYLKGSFNEMLFWTFDVPKNYVSKVTLEEGEKFFGYTKDAIFNFNKFFWIYPLLSLFIFFIKGISWRIKFLIITLAILSFFTIVPGFYFYGHYWIQLIPGLSILAAATTYGINHIITAIFKLNSPFLKYIYIGIFTISIYSHVSKFKQYYFNPNYDIILRNTYGNNPFPETMEVAKYMNAFLQPDDKIALLGSEPQFFIYTNRNALSKHIFFYSLVTDMPQHKEWQREFSKDVELAKPKYLIYYNIPISLLVQPNTDRYIFDWANKYVTENYNIIGLVDMIPGQRANYVWREQLNNYKPQAQEQIFIYERKQVIASDSLSVK